MTKETFENSKATGAHAQLAQLEGTWAGSTKTWFEPDKLADESPMTGTISPVLGGRFMMHTYQGSLSGKPFEGMALIGYDLGSKTFQTAWVDSFHMGTGIMFSQGEKKPDGFEALGTYGEIEYGQAWGWRTEITLVSQDQLLLTAYNRTPDGQEAKATETVYTRQS